MMEPDRDDPALIPVSLSAIGYGQPLRLHNKAW